MEKIKAAVIGLGRVGWLFELDEKREKPCSHVGAYLASSNVELVAVADICKSKLNDFNKIHPQINGYTDYEDLLNREEPQIVSVTTPVETHTKLVRNICRFDSVLAIFVEKPIATNVADANRMVETCKQFQVKLAVNHTRRWSFAFRHLKEKLQEGVVGDLLAFRGVFCGEDPLTLGIHMADLACWVMEKNTTVQLTHVDVPYILFDIDLIGSRGRVQIVHNGEKFLYYSPSKEKRYEEKYGRELELYADLLGHRWSFSEAMQNAIADLVTCAETDKQPDCTGEMGLDALRLYLEKFGEKKYPRGGRTE